MFSSSDRIRLNKLLVQCEIVLGCAEETINLITKLIEDIEKELNNRDNSLNGKGLC
jgi:hypothetical protein